MNISQTAAFPELTSDAAARSQLAAIRQGLGLVGTVLGVAVTPVLYGRLGWGGMGLWWGALIGGLYLASLPGFRALSHHAPGETSHFGWREGMQAIARNRAFQIYLLFHLAIRFALACVQSVLPFYATHVLMLQPVHLSLILGVMLGCAVVTVPLWPPIVRLLEPRGAGIFVTLYMAVLLVPFLQLRDLPGVLVAAALLGPAYAGITVVLDLLYAQIVDSDFVRVKRSRAGMLSGLMAMVLRLSPALVGLVLGDWLERSGYNPQLAVQPADTLTALRVLMGILPGIALLVGAALLWIYPIRGACWAELQQQVRELRDTPETTPVVTG